MDTYEIEPFRDAEKYKNFMHYMLSRSDAFSVIYFRYTENEKMKKKTRLIHDSLKKYKIYSKRTNKWPGTETADNRHIYQFAAYRADVVCLDILTLVSDIYEWDYPNAPMDLCFYKNGYCWLEITAHEGMSTFYSDDEDEIALLREMGVVMNYCGKEPLQYYDDIVANIKK